MAGSQTDTSVRTHRLQSYPAEPEKEPLSDCYVLTSGKNSLSQSGLRKPHGRRPRPTQQHPPCLLPSSTILSVPPACRPQRTMLGSRHGHTAFPGRQHSSHRPGAGLQLASLQLPEGFQQTLGTQVGCLPAKKPQAPHQKEPHPKSQETPEQGPQPRLQVRVMSHFQTRVLLSWHSSGTSVLKALWWVLRDLWVETH